MNVEQRQAAADPQTKPADSACMLLSSTTYNVRKVLTSDATADNESGSAVAAHTVASSDDTHVDGDVFHSHPTDAQLTDKAAVTLATRRHRHTGGSAVWRGGQ